ncbi:MAG TPA: class I SAM-dependent methyltransferase [Chitinophagaceae bacterium]|nr:class I SAM-dependent methyltransferase [Chitinophagaceae bacterium]
MKEEWTGERLETHFFNETSIEHLHRYAAVLEFAKGKRVLDIACGEGYGAKLLSQFADHVTGIDIDKRTIEKASSKYKASNIEFICGSALEIPAAEEKFDLITCFETIEHIDDHDKLLNELKRVLKPNGTLVISTPEKSNYSDTSDYSNPFHKKELYGSEFRELIKSKFKFADFFTQSSIAGSVIQKEPPGYFQAIYAGDFEKVNTINNLVTMYRIAIASDIKLPMLSPSLFQYPKPVSQIQFEEAEKIKKTITYRTGQILLSPFKLVRSFFKK